MCDCGKVAHVSYANLASGGSRSCGCLRVEVSSTLTKTHGLSKTPTYRIWRAMKQRCYRLADVGYVNYGGRGITVCERWVHSYENFLADMGERPTEKGVKFSIERNDNNGNYEPGNCRWATFGEQRRNCRTTHWLEFNGEKKSIAEWSEITRISSSLIYRRLGLGWPPEAALTIKPKIGQCIMHTRRGGTPLSTETVIDNLHNSKNIRSVSLRQTPH